MENLNMAKQNKVAVNLAQDFTDEEKAQARQNIGAGTGGSNIMFSSVLGGADNSLANAQISHNRQNLPTTFDYYDMTVTNANSNTKAFALLSTDMTDGMVVMNNGHAVTRSIPVVKNTHYINYINDPGTLSEDAYTEMTDAIANNEPVVIVSATGSSASYLQFTRQDSTGHFFTGYNSSNDIIMEMHVASTRAVTITTKSLDTVPDNGTNGQVLTWNGSTYSWANKTVWQPGFNMTGRANTSDTSLPYMDCNWIPKWGYAGFGTDSSTTADAVNEVTLADGQLTLEVTHKVRSNYQVQGAMYFRIKMNKTGASGLSVFGDFHECNRTSIPDSYSFCVCVDDPGDYVQIEHPTLGDVYFPERVAGDSTAYMIELKCFWVNSKHYRTWATIQLYSPRYDINGFTGGNGIVYQWGTLSSTQNEV